MISTKSSFICFYRVKIYQIDCGHFDRIANPTVGPAVRVMKNGTRAAMAGRRSGSGYDPFDPHGNGALGVTTAFARFTHFGSRENRS